MCAGSPIIAMVYQILCPGFAPYIDDYTIGGTLKSHHYYRGAETFLIYVREELIEQALGRMHCDVTNVLFVNRSLKRNVKQELIKLY